MPKNVITGQKVSQAKVDQAKELRQNMTPAERALWQQLRANRLDDRHFRRQQIIDGFIVDFYCHQAGLVIEVDGPIHNQQQEADAERETILRARGLRIIRFTNQQVLNDMPMVLREIKGVLAVRPTPQPPPNLGGGVNTSPPLAGEGPGEGSNA